MGEIFYLSVVFSFVLFGILAARYVAPHLKRLPMDKALEPLVLCHACRYVGLAFLVPGVTGPELPTAFSRPVAYGDLLAAALPLLAWGALRWRLRMAIALVWVFNVVGTADFLYAFYQGYTNRVGPGELGTMYFVPAVFVPALFVVHLLIFWLLIRQALPRGIRT